MIARLWARHTLSLLLFWAFALGAQAQQQEFKPSVGQSGKDVVWVPSPQTLVDRMLDMAKVTPNDFLMDLGSGDGRTVITAAKRGTRALGIEYNPDMVALSQKNAAAAGVADKARFERADIFKTDLSKATVITLFLLTDLNLRLRPTLLGLKPGTRVVSNTFRMGEWEPDETSALGCDTYCTAYMWIVPAHVDGAWRSKNGDLALKQEFQMLSGSLKNGSQSTAISGRVRGDEISFTAGSAEYHGRVTGKGIEGTVKTNGATSPWKAER